MGNDKWRRQVYDAIARGDAPMLRQMATNTNKQEASMWLTLLARMLEVDAGRRRHKAARVVRLAAPPPTRRIGSARRAG